MTYLPPACVAITQESDDEDESAGGIGDPGDESSESTTEGEGEAPVGFTVSTQPQDPPREKTSDPEPSPNPTLDTGSASSSDTKKDEGKTDTVVTVDFTQDEKTEQLEKCQPTQEGPFEKMETQGVKGEVSPVAFQGCEKEEAKQSNPSAEEANSSFVSIYNVFPRIELLICFLLMCSEHQTISRDTSGKSYSFKNSIAPR